MFLATKIVEAKRFSKEVGDKAQVKLKEQQDRKPVPLKKLTRMGSPKGDLSGAV